MDTEIPVGTIIAQVSGCTSIFKIKSEQVANILKTKGFLICDYNSRETTMQAVGKWSHRKTRKLVHKIMQRCSKDPLAQISATPIIKPKIIPTIAPRDLRDWMHGERRTWTL